MPHRWLVAAIPTVRRRSSPRQPSWWLNGAFTRCRWRISAPASGSAVRRSTVTSTTRPRCCWLCSIAPSTGCCARRTSLSAAGKTSPPRCALSSNVRPRWRSRALEVLGVIPLGSPRSGCRRDEAGVPPDLHLRALRYRLRSTADTSGRRSAGKPPARPRHRSAAVPRRTSPPPASAAHATRRDHDERRVA